MKMNKKVMLKISGMTCTLCSYKIENKLSKLDGISEVLVNFSTEIATILFDEEICSLDKIHKSIKALGFNVDDENGTEAQKHLQRLKLKVILSLALVSPLVFAMTICYIDNLVTLFDPNYSASISKVIGALRYKIYFIHNWKIQLLLVVPVQFIIGIDFYKNAIYSIFSRVIGMDMLVAIGTGATFGYSLYTAIKYPNFDGRQLYFEAGGMVIAFVLLGKYLEAIAKRKTTDSINALSKLQPLNARVITEDGQIEKKIEEIKAGEVIIIRPGERIPLDGIILSGSGTVNEAMITGESNLIEKKASDKVIGGTVNNLGSFTFRVEKTIEDTLLASIIHLVEEAQGSKINIQKLADKICKVFVPVVILIAVLTFIFWYFYVYHASQYYIEKPILYAVAVLVVSCPCALGLATPTAISIGTGLGAKKGILIRNGQALQDACKVDTIIFDKTGTLTLGRPVVQQIIKLNENGSYNENQLLILAASLESNSEHPLGRAIYEKAVEKGEVLKATDNFIVEPGRGVRGEIDKSDIIVGTNRYLSENNIEVPGNNEDIVNRVYIAVDGICEGLITLTDSIKENVADTIEKLKNSGIKVIMVTGDSKKVAEFIGKEIGIDKIYSEIMPDKKAKIVNELKATGGFVAMVGDGINDAPALASADISIGIGSGTDVAIQSSDIVIVGNDLSRIPIAIELSKKTMKKVRANLFLSLIYNSIAIPFAAFGKLSPEIASACMALSSLSVVINSLSIRKAL
jgi:Cu+-exporting ATPase